MAKPEQAAVTGGYLAPLGDTQRIVEWEELPVRARELSMDLDPSVAGVTMLHQREWMAFLNNPDLLLIAAEKCRRSGITLCTSWRFTITAASTKEAGGDNVYYVGDTKEKGLEFIGYCAKLARIVACRQKTRVSAIEQFIFEDQDERGEETRFILSFRIRFASGHQIVALSSRPQNIRGLQGIVIIDEAAFHTNVGEVIEAAVALLIWGSKIVVISSHNGDKSAFNTLIRDIRAGQYGKTAAVFKITFDECVANGLYERVCAARGKTPTPAGKREWYEGIRKSYGPRKAAMRQELDCIPMEGEGSAIPGVWIYNAMREERTVLRWHLSDDFNAQRVEVREAEAEAWIKRNLEPLFKLLDPSLEHYFGMDFARSGHLSAIPIIEKQRNLMRKVPFAIELHNCPSRQQEQVVLAICQSLPRFMGGGMDGTGPGLVLAEYIADKFPNVHNIKLSEAWYRDNMGEFVQGFEDGIWDIPKDSEHESDLRDLQRVGGIVKPPKEATATAKSDDGGKAVARHADYAIALALGDFAVRHPQYVEQESQRAGSRRLSPNGWMDDEDASPLESNFEGWML